MHFVHCEVLCLCKVWSDTVLYLVCFKWMSSGRDKSAVLPGELRTPDPGPNCFTSDRKVNKGVEAKETLWRVSQASRLSIHYPASPAADVPVRMRTQAHQFQAAKWFCLTSLYSTFDWVLCLSRSFDFWTKRFARYGSKVIVCSMISLVIWCRGEPSQCISVLSVFGVFHNGYY